MPKLIKDIFSQQSPDLFFGIFPVKPIAANQLYIFFLDARLIKLFDDQRDGDFTMGSLLRPALNAVREYYSNLAALFNAFRNRRNSDWI